jgi:hypothetical protein
MHGSFVPWYQCAEIRLCYSKRRLLDESWIDFTMKLSGTDVGN